MLRTSVIMSIIYKATNNLNGKFYIGRCSSSLKIREYKHWWYANNKQSNSPFPNALRKYGRSSFTWEIIEECDNSVVGEREIFWIQKLNPSYNATFGGDGGKLGIACPEHVKEATRKARQRKVKNKKTGKIYNSLKEASEDTKKYVESICRSCRNPNGGWCYVE